MIVVNLFAGPGVGKSTTAAGLFHRLKVAGRSVELVTEYAKDLTWEKNHCQLGNQMRILAEQHHRLHRLDGQVDIVITDAPLLISAIYAERWLPDSFYSLVHDLHGLFNNRNFYLERPKEARYETAGRNEDLSGAVALDRRIKCMLDVSPVPHISILCDQYTIARMEHHLL